MTLSILPVLYLLASITYIIGLKMLSKPSTARVGNLIAAAGMIIAIFSTIFLYKFNGKGLGNYTWIFFSNGHRVYHWLAGGKKSEDDCHAGTCKFL